MCCIHHILLLIFLSVIYIEKSAHFINIQAFHKMNTASVLRNRILSAPQKTSQGSSSHSPTPSPKDNNFLDLKEHRLVFPIFVLYVDGIMQSMLFCVSGFVQHCVCSCSSF